MSAETPTVRKREQMPVSHCMEQEPDPDSEDLDLVLDNENCGVISGKLFNLLEPAHQRSQHIEY